MASRIESRHRRAFVGTFIGSRSSTSMMESLEARQLLSAGGPPQGNPHGNGAKAPGSISGNVYQDLTGNGVRDGQDNGLLNWTVKLDRNADGVYDATTYTDANGNYTFSDLVAANYRVRLFAPGSWISTTAQPADITLAAGVNVTGVNFGNFQTVSLVGQVFADANGNGVRDADEGILAGVLVTLDRNSDGIIDAVATTDANGYYYFGRLGPGTYQVREVVPDGLVQTTLNPADVTVVSGFSTVGLDFGVTPILPV